MMRPIICFTLLTSLTASAASGNLLSAIPVDEQAKRADLIVIATIRREAICDVKGKSRPCFELNNVFVIRNNKRKVRVPIRVVIDSEIDELNVKCCEIGKEYLMILKEYKNSYFPFFGQTSIRQLIELD